MLTLIDFYADWCGPCKMMEPFFEELKPLYEGKVTFTKIDVEADNATAAQYGVMSIPTFVILKDNQEVARKIGAMPKDMLKAWIDSNL
jgi:thioredoxin 1